MSDFVDVKGLQDFLVRHGQAKHANAIIDACKKSHANQHGLLPKWLHQLDELPHVEVDEIELSDAVKLSASQFDVSQRRRFEQQLLNFSPWRKGPFDLFGVHIDTEWRSDIKWQRLAGHLELCGKRILDVGCGNGYYMFRMLGAGANIVLGVDPVALYVIQFLLINKYVKSTQLQVLPIGIEALPVVNAFDMVFSMGVLYHRRTPLDHLSDLKHMLTSSGELVLETLVLEGDGENLLVPEHRYAGMKNVWSIPTVPTLSGWLEQVGFNNIAVLDLSPTTLDEQRQTKWMTTYSLNQFLDPMDQNITIEGHPSPVRAMIKCTV